MKYGHTETYHNRQWHCFHKYTSHLWSQRLGPAHDKIMEIITLTLYKVENIKLT